jgi:hypothetical protein
MPSTFSPKPFQPDWVNGRFYPNKTMVSGGLSFLLVFGRLHRRGIKQLTVGARISIVKAGIFVALANSWTQRLKPSHAVPILTGQANSSEFAQNVEK